MNSQIPSGGPEMEKPPEEGEIWEWRAFGEISRRASSTVTAHPIRFGLLCHRDEDIYLISPRSSQNVKIRKSGNAWLLKFKLLVTTVPRRIELYRESASLMYRFPINQENLHETGKLLLTELPASAASRESFDRETFMEVLGASSPPICRVNVPKTRSQYLVEDGWIELADVYFARGRVQSLSIHSHSLEVVQRTLGELEPDSGLEAMNYVEACRRWGG